MEYKISRILLLKNYQYITIVYKMNAEFLIMTIIHQIKNTLIIQSGINWVFLCVYLYFVNYSGDIKAAKSSIVHIHTIEYPFSPEHIPLLPTEMHICSAFVTSLKGAK